MHAIKSLGLALIPAIITMGCSGSDVTVTGSGGAESAGGASGMGGLANSGGVPVFGGAPATGGTTSGGTPASTGGANSAGGTVAAAGTTATGGMANTGGAATGGSIATGGAINTGGISAAAGSPTTGGSRAAGGDSALGGTAATGGSKAAGGTTTTGGTKSNGGTSSTGGTPATGGAAGSVGTCGALTDSLGASSVTTPEGVKPGVSNWRVWGTATLAIAPVYTAPLANCGTLVCFTTGTGAGSAGTRTARVAYLDASDQLVATYNLGAFECRGLAAEPDGHFAALLWAPGTATDCNDYTVNGRIYVQRFDIAGTPGWTTELTNLSTTGLGPNCPTDFGLGDSRMDFGGGKYGVYYHVHSQSGHEGDTLKYIDTTGVETTTWPWGCSHSMSNLLRFNPASSNFMPACVTDCYPGTTSSDFTTGSIGGVYINNRNKVIDVDGGCNGSVAGELGGGAVAPSGWKIVFNSHQNAATMGQSSYSKTTMNQDIGFASIASGLTLSGSVVWLTTTTLNEADSAISRYTPACDSTEQYVVGWAETGTTYKYRLGRVNAAGAFIEAPLDITATAKWGRRDDPFRTHINGDIVWSWFDAAASTSLRFARLRSGNTAQCASF